MINNEQSKKSILNLLGPKKSFFFGLLVAIFLAVTTGFVISTSILLSDDSSGSVASAKTEVDENTIPTEPTLPSEGAISIKPVTDEDHVKGDLNKAEVVLVEFSDLECPFCKRFHPTMQQVVDDYDGKVAWVYRHFPLESLHSKARNEAEASECAAELGGNDGFWEFVDALFEVTPSNNGLRPEQLPEIAADIGLDRSEFESCLDSGKYTDKVNEHLADANAAGGTGTPYSVLIDKDGNTVPVSGALPVDQIKSAIDTLMQ
ncbi:DsbA family protein [Patescibacteria group bacterium]